MIKEFPNDLVIIFVLVCERAYVSVCVRVHNCVKLRPNIYLESYRAVKRDAFDDALF